MALSFLWYQLLGMIGELPNLPFLSNMLEWLTLDFHYRSISRGVLDTRDIVYFASFTGLFLYFTKLKFSSRKW
jgi:ABC-2 type transport system permease protein